MHVQQHRILKPPRKHWTRVCVCVLVLVHRGKARYKHGTSAVPWSLSVNTSSGCIAPSLIPLAHSDYYYWVAVCDSLSWFLCVNVLVPLLSVLASNKAKTCLDTQP